MPNDLGRAPGVSGLVDALDYVYLKVLHGHESQYYLSPSLGRPKVPSFKKLGAQNGVLRPSSS